MRWLLTVVGLMISLGSRAEPLGAQGRVRAGAGAGIAMPSGLLQDQANPGWRAFAALDVWLPEMPTSLRVDAAYDRFGLKPTQVGSTERLTGARTIASASISLSVGSFDTLSKFSPYALAGVTMNRLGCVGTSGLASEARLECAPASQMATIMTLASAPGSLRPSPGTPPACRARTTRSAQSHPVVLLKSCRPRLACVDPPPQKPRASC